MPEHCDAVLRLFHIELGCAGQFTDHTFRTRAELVEVVYRQRRGARGVVFETEATARSRAESLVQSLADGGACRLMNGAKPWALIKVDKTTGESTPLCDRAGPFSPRLAASIGVLALPPRARHVHQAAQTEREKKAAVKQLQTCSTGAERTLVEAAAAAVETAEAAAALIELAAKRGQQLDICLQPEMERRSAQLREAGLGDLAAAFVAARLLLTKHCVRPDAKGGK